MLPSSEKPIALFPQEGEMGTVQDEAVLVPVGRMFRLFRPQPFPRGEDRESSFSLRGSIQHESGKREEKEKKERGRWNAFLRF